MHLLFLLECLNTGDYDYVSNKLVQVTIIKCVHYYCLHHIQPPMNHRVTHFIVRTSMKSPTRSQHIMWARNNWTTQQTANNRCRQNAHCHKEITRFTIVQNMWNFMLTSSLTLVSNSSLYSQNTLPPDAQMNNLVIQNRINIKCRQPMVTINLTPNAPFKDNNYY